MTECQAIASSPQSPGSRPWQGGWQRGLPRSRWRERGHDADQRFAPDYRAAPANADLELLHVVFVAQETVGQCQLAAGAADAQLPVVGHMAEPKLIASLMGDWCAVIQPDFENQSMPVNVDSEMPFDNKMRGERSILFAILTEVGHG